MGREFVDLFETWAETYDDAVSGMDVEYREVFENYESILDQAADRVTGSVGEFGVGTGNLTARLLQRGHTVYGVEPSRQMRLKASQRFPQLYLVDGDFLDFPPFPGPIQSVVSTYAFHHLTDSEKRESISRIGELLGPGGHIVCADTVFESAAERQVIVRDAQSKGFVHLLADLNREYYTTTDILDGIFRDAGFAVSWKRCNRFVWLMDAIKSSVRGHASTVRQ